MQLKLLLYPRDLVLALLLFKNICKNTSLLQIFVLLVCRISLI